MAEGGGFGRSVARGALLGAGLLLLLFGGIVLARTQGWLGSSEAPDSLLVVCVMPDSTGAFVAGLMYVVDSGGEVISVDPNMQVTIPGTSYSRLSDAHSFGGGAAVAETYAQAEGSRAMDWVVLPTETWGAIIDAAGGASIDMSVGPNVFVGDELYVIDEGTARRDADEIIAIMSWASVTEGRAADTARQVATLAVADLLSDGWQKVHDSFAQGAADTSISARRLEAFAEAAFAQK